MDNKQHIVITWELGSGYGHASVIKALTLKLLEKNIKVSLIVKQLDLFNELVALDKVDIYQAPIWARQKESKKQINLSDILFDVGYKNVDSLVTIVKAWQLLFNKLQPNYIISNFSPTAVIASHSLEIPISITDTGYGIPAEISPLQNLRIWESQNIKDLKKADTNLLACVNKANKIMGLKPYKKVTELFKCNDNVLCTFPELDPYIGRINTPYWGGYFEISKGKKLTWKAKGKKRIIVYLKVGLQHNALIINALKKYDCEVVVHIKDDSKNNLKIDDKKIQFSATPICLTELFKTTDLVISTAGHGLITASLIHGIPHLLLPTNIEQKNNAILVQQMGAGIELIIEDSQHSIDEKVNKLLTNKRYKDAAIMFKEKYKHYDAQEQIELIAQHYNDLVRNNV